jgi:hypothetical protein
MRSTTTKEKARIAAGAAAGRVKNARGGSESNWV